MAAVRLLVRSVVRQRAGALVGLAVLIAFGVGTSLGAFAIAWRTDNAFPDHLRRAEVSEVVVNTGLLTDRLKEIVTSTPGVIDVVSDALYVATPDVGEPRSRIEVESMLQVRASQDGRYQRRDRPIVHQGRLIEGSGEAFLGLGAVAALGVQVGDELPLAFWAATPNEDELDPTEVIEPIGRTRARVVGVGVFPEEVLPDELYIRRQVVLSPDLVRPFDCTPSHPPPDDTRTLEQLTVAFFPPDCARDPAFFSLRVAGGDRGVAAVMASLTERIEEENSRLPKVMRDLDLGFSVEPTLTSEERARIRRSLAPSVIAFRLFGLVAALATLAVTGLAGIRTLRRIESEAQVWFELGMTRRQRAAVAGVPLGGAAVVGVAGALVVGWALSGLGPVASARAVVPHGSRGLPVVLAAAVAGAALAFLAIEFAVAAWRATRARPAPSPARTSRWCEVAARTGNVPLTVGVRAAIPGGAQGAGARAVLIGAVTAVGAVVGCVVFSSNMSGLVADPTRFGWPFDIGVVINLGYAGADEDVIADSLKRDDVERWTTVALPGEVNVRGQSVPAVAGRPGFADLQLPIVDGRYPKNEDEVALGARSAELLGVAIGDRVSVGSQFGDRDATVSGLVVLPSLGQFQTDRAGLGTGVLLSSRFFAELVAAAESEREMPPGSIRDVLGAFVAIDLRDGADAGGFVRQLREEVEKWDVDGFPPQVYPTAVRPPEVADVASIRTTPALLAALLAATMAAALALAVMLATRARRRELAILRALGCTARQLQASVAWHTLTVVGCGLFIGLFIGVAIGSAAWRQFAGGLGIVPSVEIPAVWIALVAAAAAAVALITGAIPATAAARSASADQLRER